MLNRLIITGAGGFLGSNLVKRACIENVFDEVIAITLGADEMRSRFAGNGNIEKLKIYEADALKTGEVIPTSGDIILNCAYPRAMKGSDVALGLDYVESVFVAAAKNKVRGIVNISSQSVYDPQRSHSAIEIDTPVLLDGYSVGKYCMEILLRNVCKDIPYTNIRLASLIGPGFNVRVPNKMIGFALSTGKITVECNNKKFGYLDIDDAVRGLIGVLSMNSHDWEHIYNLGGENTYSLYQIAECIQSLFNDKGLGHIQIIQKEGSGVLNSSLDDTLLKKDIGEYQHVSFKKSLEKILHSMQQ